MCAKELFLKIIFFMLYYTLEIISVIMMTNSKSYTDAMNSAQAIAKCITTQINKNNDCT